MGGVNLAGLSETTARQLMDKGADVNKMAWFDWPPIAYLSRGDKGEHPEKIQVLIQYGADIHARAPHGITAIHAAAKAGLVSVLKVLLNHGADLNAKTDDGKTPLSLAISAGRHEASQFLKTQGGRI